MKNNFEPLQPEPAYVPVHTEPEPLPSVHETTNEASTSPMNSLMSNTSKPGATPPRNTKQPGKGKFSPKKLWRKFQNLDRNKKIIIISALTGLLIVAGTLLWYYVLRAEPAPPPPPPVVKEEEPPKPTTVPSPLTGVQVKPELAKLPTTGVMIENSPDARPQSGLYDAGVVFEAISEGGITRFLALYQEAQPAQIGPVRSVRPYYLDLLKPFDAPIAHVGGSGQALAEIRQQNIKDLDSFHNPNHYQRVSHRYAPHNMYTSRKQLLELQKSKGWNTSKFTGFSRKEEKKAATPTAKSIDLNISSFLYNPHFDYDAATNSYKRVMGGGPHTDEAARKQIKPKVVIALVMSHHYAGIYSVYGVNGSGAAFIFQDGTVTKGTWQKKNRDSQFTFTDTDKKTISLNPGQTWISLVASPGAVTYKP